MSLYHELKRRNVFRVAIAYLALAWLIIEITDTLFPAFGIPDWAFRFVVIVLVLGFVPTLVFSWAYEITPEGLKRERDVVREESITHLTAKRLDGITIGLIVIALGFILADRLWLDRRHAEQPANPAQPTTDAGEHAGHENVERQHPPHSIAVLPFLNMSEDPGNEYFSDGISEELLNLLAQIPELHVISRSSAFSFKGKNVDIPTIAAQLNVAYILEGSVRKAGNTVRITAQLIDVASDTHLWSETFDRTLDDIFAVQDEIASEIARALKLTMLGGGTPKATQTDPKAYALFLQARYLAQRADSEEKFREAETYLRQALAIDPGYAPSWERLANLSINQAVTGLADFDDGYREAIRYARQAIDLDPEFAHAHSSLGWIAMMYERNLESAAAHLRRALTLAPEDPKIIGTTAVLAQNIGRFDESIELGKLAVTLDPLNPIIYGNLATTYRLAGDLDEAANLLEKALQISPDDDWSLSHLAMTRLMQGEAKSALELAEKIEQLARQLWVRAIVYHALGREAESMVALDTLKSDHANRFAYNIAMIHAARNEVYEAFEWLNRALDEDQQIDGSAPFSPFLKNLHDDPRWNDFRRRIGRSEEELESIEFELPLPI